MGEVFERNGDKTSGSVIDMEKGKKRAAKEGVEEHTI